MGTFSSCPSSEVTGVGLGEGVVGSGVRDKGVGGGICDAIPSLEHRETFLAFIIPFFIIVQSYWALGVPGEVLKEVRWEVM